MVLERLSETVFGKTRTGKWEGVGGRTCMCVVDQLSKLQQGARYLEIIR